MQRLFLTILFIFSFSFYSLADISVCFTPPNKCGDFIVEKIKQAKQSIYIQAYGFTSKKIIDALIEAKNRGVEIEIILDRSNFHNKKQSVIKLLESNQIKIYQDKVAGIAHNKVMIIDNITVITGSFNFTDNADKRNAENVIVLHDSNIAKQYYDNWKNRIIFKSK
jgi:phospholipase D